MLFSPSDNYEWLNLSQLQKKVQEAMLDNLIPMEGD